VSFCGRETAGRSEAVQVFRRRWRPVLTHTSRPISLAIPLAMLRGAIGNVLAYLDVTTSDIGGDPPAAARNGRGARAAMEQLSWRHPDPRGGGATACNGAAVALRAGEGGGAIPSSRPW